MERRKKWDAVCAVFWLLQLAAQVFLLLSVVRLNMLPADYLAILGGVLLAVWLICGAVMLLRSKQGKYESNKKETPSVWRRCVGLALAVLFTAASAVGALALTQAYSAVSDITGDAEPDGVTMAVYVAAGDPALSLDGARAYTFAALGGHENWRTEALMESVSDELDTELTPRWYSDLSVMMEAFFSGEVDAVVMNTAYAAMLVEEELYADLDEAARVLYSQVIAEQPVDGDGDGATLPTGETEPEEERTVTNSPFLVYISGSDTRNTYLTTSRSDVNILMVVNPVSKQILLLNTPRDYYITFPGGGGARDKLTHCGMYGITCSMDALAGLYRAEVDYYLQINFTGFETLIDAIGGITVYSDTSFTSSVTGHYFPKGENTLNGKAALLFARERKHLSSGDNGRGRNQMKVIKAVIEKLTTGTTVISNYSAILDSMHGMFTTNVTTDQLGELVKMQLGDLASWNILSYAVTGTGGSSKTYSIPGLYSYVMYPDQSSVDYARALIDRIFAGEVLTEEDTVCPEGFVYDTGLPTPEELAELRTAHTGPICGETEK